MGGSRWQVVAVALTLLLLPVHALAQTEADKTSARKLFFEARTAYEGKDYEKAAELFGRSNALYPAPTAALGLARAQVAAGKLVAGYETLVAIVTRGTPADASPTFKQAAADAAAERDALEPRLPALVIQVRGPKEPVVTIDGRPIGAAALGVKWFVDPGERVVTAGGAGFESQSRTVTAAEGDARDVVFDLHALAARVPEPAPRPSPRPAEPADKGMTRTRVIGIVVGSAGVASLAVAAVSGALYLSKKATVDDKCHEVRAGEFACDDDAGPAAASAGRTFGWVNAITLGGGVVGIGLGMTLFVLGGEHQNAAVRAGLGRLTVEGAF